MKILFEYLTNSFSLLDNPIDDYMAMAIVGVMAYMIAYSIVGKLYRYDIIDGRGAGHIWHWIIRGIVFAIIYYAFATAIRIYKWFNALPDYKWCIMSSAVGLFIIGKILYRVWQDRRMVAVKEDRDNVN